LHQDITQPLSMILAQWKKISNKLSSCMKNNPRENPTLYLQNSSRYLLGFPLKLSHAPLQVQILKSIKWPPSLSPFFRRV